MGVVTPPKRKGGRVTPKRSTPMLPLPPADPLGFSAHTARTSQSRPNDSRSPNSSNPPRAQGRYTPPKVRAIRIRPDWHKVAGAASLVLGMALFFVCTFNGWGIHEYGGHIWYVVGLGIAGSSIWWWGALDPAP